MKRYRFENLCQLAESGHAVTVLNPSNHQTGDILSCSGDKMEVFTREAERKSWDFHDCEEIISRSYPQDDKWDGFPE